MFSKLKNKLRDLPVAFKITAWYTLFLTIIFITVMAYTMKAMEGIRLNDAHEDLTKRIEETIRHPRRIKGYDDGVYIGIFGQNNQLVQGMMPPGMPSPAPKFSQNKIKILRENGKEFHYYDMQLNNGTWLRGAIATNRLLQRTQREMLVLLIALFLFIFIAAIGGYKIIKRGFKPVKQISNTAEAIGNTKDLSTRIDIGSGNDEIHSMAHTFNSMLDKIQNTVEREKQFSSDVSHELRTPVAVIMSESEYSKDYVKNIEEAKESFASIFKQSQNMAALINQILDLTRMQNKAQIEKERLDFSLLTQVLLKEYSLLTKSRDISLTTDIAPDLFVEGNANLLKRALGNYLDNALKFTNTAIKVSLAKEKDKVVLRVRDNGLGIPKEDISKIWDRLYQVNKARTKGSSQGLGLGLSLVQEISKLHQGKSYVESSSAEGTTFVLELPSA